MIIILASNFCTNFLKILFPTQNDFFSQVTMKKVFNSGTAQTNANSNERKEKKKPRIIFRKKAGQGKEERRGPSGKNFKRGPREPLFGNFVSSIVPGRRCYDDARSEIRVDLRTKYKH